MRKGQSSDFLRRLRRKYGLGEFRKAARRQRKVSRRVRPGPEPKSEYQSPFFGREDEVIRKVLDSRFSDASTQPPSEYV